MTTIVVMQPEVPITLIVDGDVTTVLVPTNGPQSVVMGESVQTIIFNTEGPPGPSGDSFDPGDLVAIYRNAKET